MAYTTQYIGSRYVPVFADPVEWDSTRTYEPLTIVLNEGNSYTSRQFVPVGVQIGNEDYWVETGNYNAQVEAYRQEVKQLDTNLSAVLPFDSAPMQNSVKGVTSNGLYNSINPLELKTQYVTPEMFGGIADGSTLCDDAFTACIDSGLPIKLNAGTYLVSKSIDINVSKQSLNGVGGQSIIRTNNKELEYIIMFYGAAPTYMDRFKENAVNGNFTVYGTGLSTEQTGVIFGDNINNFFGNVIYNITVRNVYTCFKFNSHNYKNKFVNLVTDYTCVYAVSAQGISNSGESQMFDNCAFYNGSIIISAMGSSFHGCAIHIETRCTSPSNAEHEIAHSFTNGCYSFIGCHFEALNYGTKLHDVVFETNQYAYLNFTDCEFIITVGANGNYEATDFVASYTKDGLAQSVFSNCDFSGLMEGYTGGLVDNAQFINCMCRPYEFYGHSDLSYSSRKSLKSVIRKKGEDKLFYASGTEGVNFNYTDNGIEMIGYHEASQFGNLYKLDNTHKFFYYKPSISTGLSNQTTIISSHSEFSNISFFDNEGNLLEIPGVSYYQAYKLSDIETSYGSPYVSPIPDGAAYIAVRVVIGGAWNNGHIIDNSCIYLF